MSETTEVALTGDGDNATQMPVPQRASFKVPKILYDTIYWAMKVRFAANFPEFVGAVGKMYPSAAKVVDGEIVDINTARLPVNPIDLIKEPFQGKLEDKLTMLPVKLKEIIDRWELGYRTASIASTGKDYGVRIKFEVVSDGTEVQIHIKLYQPDNLGVTIKYLDNQGEDATYTAADVRKLIQIATPKEDTLLIIGLDDVSDIIKGGMAHNDIESAVEWVQDAFIALAKPMIKPEILFPPAP